MSFPRYSAYKDSAVSWIGNVPVHWESWKLSHAFESIGSGTTPPSTEPQWYEGGSTPWVTTGELRENIVTETAKGVTDAALKQFTALRVHPAGSLVIAMYGATIGRLGVLGVDAATNQACCVLSKPKALTVAFTYYWLQGFKQIIIDLFSTGGGQPNISQDIVSSLRVPAPEILEQKQITEFLDRETAKIDALVAEQEQLITLLKEKRQAVISHAVTKGLDPSVPMKDSGVEWLGDVPAHWMVKPLKRLAKLVTGMTPPTDDADNYEEDGFPWIRPDDLDPSGNPTKASKHLSRKGMELSRLIEPQSTLVCCIGSIGKIGFTDELAATNQQITALVVKQNCRFIFYSTQAAQSALDLAATGNVLRILNSERFGSIRYPEPPVEEQTKIARFLDLEVQKFDGLLRAQEDAISLLLERRSALISAAVTGQIDVRGLATQDAA